MHEVLRQRLLRRIESLPEEQIYQVLDYIEFLESKYARELQAEASGLQKFAEGLEDRLRKRAVNPATLREAFQLISAADRVLSGVSTAGKQLLNELGGIAEPPADRPPTRATPGRESGGSGRPPAREARRRSGRATSEGRPATPPSTDEDGAG